MELFSWPVKKECHEKISEQMSNSIARLKEKMEKLKLDYSVI